MQNWDGQLEGVLIGHQHRNIYENEALSSADESTAFSDLCEQIALPEVSHSAMCVVKIDAKSYTNASIRR